MVTRGGNDRSVHAESFPRAVDWLQKTGCQRFEIPSQLTSLYDIHGNRCGRAEPGDESEGGKDAGRKEPQSDERNAARGGRESGGRVKCSDGASGASAALTLSIFKQLCQTGHEVSEELVHEQIDGGEQMRHTGSVLGGTGGVRGLPLVVASRVPTSSNASRAVCTIKGRSSENAVSATLGRPPAFSSSAECVTRSPGKPRSPGSVETAKRPRRPKEPSMRVSVVGRSLRKLVGLLERIPPSLGTEEPWKRAYAFATSWLDECSFLIAHDHGGVSGGRAVFPERNSKSAACRPEGTPPVPPQIPAQFRSSQPPSDGPGPGGDCVSCRSGNRGGPNAVEQPSSRSDGANQADPGENNAYRLRSSLGTASDGSQLDMPPANRSRLPCKLSGAQKRLKKGASAATPNRALIDGSPAGGMGASAEAGDRGNQEAFRAAADTPPSKPKSSLPGEPCEQKISLSLFSDIGISYDIHCVMLCVIRKLLVGGSPRGGIICGKVALGAHGKPVDNPKEPAPDTPRDIRS